MTPPNDKDKRDRWLERLLRAPGMTQGLAYWNEWAVSARTAVERNPGSREYVCALRHARTMKRRAERAAGMNL